MTELLPYIRRIERELSTQTLTSAQWDLWSASYLSSPPTQELREVVQLPALKNKGIFFTDRPHATNAALLLGDQPPNQTKYLDPQCGAGDLLLAVADRLPLKPTIHDTLSLWGNSLHGCDLFPTFVRATKARLALLAMNRSRSRARVTVDALTNLFPSITTGDALATPAIYAHCDRVIMNPPFLPIDAPNGCSWSTGKINSAAYFLEQAVLNCSPGTRIVAILPDVLRSGSRYTRWRRHLTTHVTVKDIRLCGVFDRYTDVDVFLLHLDVTKPTTAHTADNAHDWYTNNPDSNGTVSAHFAINVGAVVPYRDPHCGPSYPYLHVKSLPPWSTVADIPETRRFTGRVFVPPFVAIRRTSSPKDPKRSVATIVQGKNPVAVENHLLVCMPSDHSIDLCQALLKRLRSPKTDEWLARRIRCRHLTVSTVGEIPWWEDHD